MRPHLSQVALFRCGHRHSKNTFTFPIYVIHELRILRDCTNLLLTKNFKRSSVKKGRDANFLMVINLHFKSRYKKLQAGQHSNPKCFLSKFSHF